MSVTQGRTRRQIRQTVGYNLMGADFVVSSTSAAGGDTTSLIDNRLRGGDDVHNGKHVVSTSGSNDGDITRVDDYDDTAKDATLNPGLTSIIPAGMGYEMWDEWISPAMVNQYIDDALVAAAGRVYDHAESLAIHLHPDVRRYAVPSEFDMINRVEARASFVSRRVDNMDAAWKGLNGGSAAVDTEARRQGVASNRLSLPASLSAETLFAESPTFSGIDVNRYDTIEAWVQSSVALAAGEVRFTFEGGSNLDPIDWPATASGVWTYVRVILTKPTGVGTDITQIKTQYNGSGDSQATTIWLDDIKLVINDSALWANVPHHHWSIDKEVRDIVFSVRPSYRLMKLTGGSVPTLLANDSSTVDIHDDWAVAYATVKAAQHVPDRERRSSLVKFWSAQLDLAQARFPMLRDVRMVK